eukprot:UN14906
MLWPWVSVGATWMQDVRFVLPTYWLSVCVSNEAHKAQDYWECNDNDDVECILPTSALVIKGYGLSDGNR